MQTCARCQAPFDAPPGAPCPRCGTPTDLTVRSPRAITAERPMPANLATLPSGPPQLPAPVSSAPYPSTAPTPPSPYAPPPSYAPSYAASHAPSHAPSYANQPTVMPHSHPPPTHPHSYPQAAYAPQPSPYAYAPQPIQVVVQNQIQAPPVMYPTPYGVPAYPPVVYVKRKDPGVAVLCSFFLPGAGQLYNGQIGKGLAFIIATIVNVFLLFVGIGFLTGLATWIWGMIDAHASAERINRGEAP
jgi:TM2 domain-containing membrane protein YozV